MLPNQAAKEFIETLKQIRRDIQHTNFYLNTLHKDLQELNETLKNLKVEVLE